MGLKRGRLGAVILIALIVLTGFLLLRDQPLGELAGALKRVQPGYVLLGLGLMFVFVGSEAMGTRVILGRLGHSVPYRRCLGYSFVGFYVSSITPSSTGGQPAQIYYMSRDGVPAAHGALDMMLLAVCYQVTILLYAAVMLLLRPGLLSLMGGGLGLLLLYGGAVMVVLTAGMLCVMFLPRAARRLTGGVLGILVRLRLIREAKTARERLDRQLEEYREGAACLRKNPGLIPVLLGLATVQLTALFSVPFVVYRAFGLSEYGPMDLIGTQVLLTVATSALPLPGAVGASEGGFVAAFALFFGSDLVTPAVLVSRGISFYSFLVLSGIITLAVHMRGRKNGPGSPIGSRKNRPIPPRHSGKQK